MSTLVPALCWVPKGVSKEVPDKVELSPEEVQRLLENATDQLKGIDLEKFDASQENVKGVRECLKHEADMEEVEEEEERPDENGEDDIEDLYDMEHYDSEDDGEKGQKVSGAGMGNNLAGLTYYASNDSDPYITLKNVSPAEDDEEEFRVLPTDNLLVVGRAEEDFSSIEIHVFSEGDDHSYSHHEILLTAFPLTLEWLDYDPEQPHLKGNYIAIGTMAPIIEVWDLDTVDVLEPVFCLGDQTIISGVPVAEAKSKLEKGKKKKKHKSKATPTSIEGHTDAVLGLSWNRIIRNVLASASADCTVRVWDMAWPKLLLTLRHTDKVQCCQWHPYQPDLLATGAYDGVIRLYNCKSSESATRSWNLSGEVEKLIWNHFKPEQLLASSEDKAVWCFNKDDGSTLYQIHAHDSAITDLSLSCYMPGLLVTAGADDTIKFWDVQDDKPVFLMSREMHMGAVMCAKFCVDSPFSLAVGGRKNGFHVINVQKLLPVMQCFKKRDLLQPVVDSGEITASTPNGDSSGSAGGTNGVISPSKSDITTMEDKMDVHEKKDDRDEESAKGVRTKKNSKHANANGNKKKNTRTKKKKH